MMFELVQRVIELFSMSSLYFSVLWFATVGLVVHSCIIAGFSKLKITDFISAFSKIYGICLVSSFLLTPICAVIITGLQQVLFLESFFAVAPINIYIWFSILMIIMLRYAMCMIFVSVPCRVWYVILLIAGGVTAITGYFVLLTLSMINQ